MTEILSYAVYRLELDEIEGSDDWFDADGRLKYKERFLFDTLKEAGEIEKSWLVALFASEQDAIEFCEGAGLSLNSDYFYFCLRTEATATIGEGEYVEVGY
ncbi:hypothetical protein B9N62_10265 [Campylobacter concisus]|uniref:Uncharacterized protein n=1 Tax=Campylobacter concisus TaxID=199 RepID=A0A1Y5MNF9_9BACT|nr:hypothetical protein [Campylobacter concisus]OUT09969.1 hypothetical protein B9N62_10265 [Campylobacter concisus]